MTEKESRRVLSLVKSRPINRARNQHTKVKFSNRFFEKIAYGLSECWFWTSSLDHSGYGRFNHFGEHFAHRVSWVMHFGPIPTGLKVLHKCDVRNCVNPDHLFLGTQMDNVRDMVSKGRYGIRNRLSGEKNPRAVLNWEQVREIRSLRGTITQNELSLLYNVSPMTISRIIHNKTWKTNENI